jgi:hypothetical protein
MQEPWTWRELIGVIAFVFGVACWIIGAMRCFQ